MIKCVFKRERTSQDYKKKPLKFKSELHNIHENVSKISLSANGDRRIQTFDGVVSYPCGTSPGRLWKTALMRHNDLINKMDQHN